MLQELICVRLHCTGCGRLLTDTDEILAPAHYATHEAALRVVLGAGWWVGRGGCVSCPDCGPVRLQTGLCHTLTCDGCGHGLLTPAGHPGHYPTQTSATAAARTAGWRPGRAPSWYCPSCVPLRSCHTRGHDFTDWQLVRLPDTAASTPVPASPEAPVTTGVPRATEAPVRGVVSTGVRVCRCCRRCGAYRSQATTLITLTPAPEVA